MFFVYPLPICYLAFFRAITRAKVTRRTRKRTPTTTAPIIPMVEMISQLRLPRIIRRKLSSQEPQSVHFLHASTKKPPLIPSSIVLDVELLIALKNAR